VLRLSGRGLRAIAATLLAAPLLAGCASLGADIPASIVVADKDRRTRWDTTVLGQRRSPVTGRVEDIRREDMLDEYWVKATDGRWYRVSKEDWDRAVVGQAMPVRPALPERRERPAVWPCIGPDGVWRCP
jgi:hypothetical protein